MKKDDVMIFWKIYKTVTYTKMRSPPIYGSYPCYWKSFEQYRPRPKPLPIQKKETH